MDALQEAGQVLKDTEKYENVSYMMPIERLKKIAEELDSIHKWGHVFSNDEKNKDMTKEFIDLVNEYCTGTDTSYYSELWTKNWEETEKKNDPVNHPSHYADGKYECIDVMREVFGEEELKIYCKINAFKYLYRANRKNGDEDVRKANWYLTYLNNNLMNKKES